MKQVCLLAILLAAAAGNLCATTTVMSCALTVEDLSSAAHEPANELYNNNPLSPDYNANAVGCFTTSFITTSAWDSLNWGAPVEPYGLSQSGLGAPTPGNSFTITDSSGPEVRSVHEDNIVVEEGANYSNGPSDTVTRAANLALVWTGAVNGWQPPGLFTPREATYPGHFNSASTPTGTDDQLLEANGAPLELDFLNEPLLGAWFEITPRSGTNSLFEVIIQAFGSDNLSLGTYTLTETAGGTGGVCTGLSATPPVPCTTTGSGAPYVGFYDPEGRIRSIYITVINPSYPNTPLAFAIDSLALDPVPEPAAPWMIGAGLAAIAFYGRKRRVRRIVSE